MQTLGQLITAGTDGFAIPAVQIEDAPRFAYRGVMLDVARHFFPVETVKAYIDRAAGLKFNALHLHLTDDQGWRIHLDSRPKLTELASGSAVGGDAGGFFSKADYRQIVEHAASRHMIVVPEVDLPGHTHAVGLAYPELAEEPVLSAHILEIVQSHGGAVPTAGEPYTGMGVGFSSLKIHDENTYDFVADVVGELAAMTPGPYLHIGGDEALGTDPADFAEFMERATEIVADLGKIPITWHEAGAAANIDPSTVGQYWGFTTPTDGMDEKARAFVRNCSGLILSPADAVYLDMKYDADSPLGLTWANGPTSVRARVFVGARLGDRRRDGCRHPRRRGTDVGRDDPHARRHRPDGVPPHRRRRRGGLVAGSLRQRPAHVGFVPRQGRGAGSAVVEPRHPVPPLCRDPLGDAVSTCIHSVRLVDAGRRVEDAWVRFDQGRVAATGIGESWRRFAEPHDAIVDGSEAAGVGAILTPGFIDIHGHGGAGESYDDGPEAIRAARALHRAHGTTRAVISLVTAPLDTLERRAAMVADLTATDADILGSHLEGPFLDPEHKGAHDATMLRAPEPAAVERLLEAGRGTIRQVTLAPELPGALHAIRLVVEAGAAAAVGHTGADLAETEAAFGAGATILTHAFNAMPGLHHRDPGPVAAAAADPRVTIEVIADGVHLHPEVVRIAFAAAPGRIALVTDAMAATGHGDGHYALGSLAVDVEDGVARLLVGGAIAGSTLTQDAALRRTVAAGVPLAEAVRALTSTPARAIGRGDDLGSLAVGAVADAVLLTESLEVMAVWTAGVAS